MSHDEFKSFHEISSTLLMWHFIEVLFKFGLSQKVKEDLNLTYSSVNLYHELFKLKNNVFTYGK